MEAVEHVVVAIVELHYIAVIVAFIANFAGLAERYFQVFGDEKRSSKWSEDKCDKVL